ncbi:hypothetical protein SE17_15630 [Kouleothrix aurantiaca]|uniref:Rhodanese domain-containing protein n=1 Tax=Kouleothrix aurantiaca TaxID=186479 RepID=A0A0N8PSD4_9CHLR|nr:hypothetical protein SE17_15630 [Kouleothrix aurantiaca]
MLRHASATPLSAWYGRRVAQQTPEEEREASVVGLFRESPGQAPRITPPDLAALLAGDAPPTVLDVRSRSQYDQSDAQIPGSVRVLADDVAEWAADEDRARAIVAYCT